MKEPFWKEHHTRLRDALPMMLVSGVMFGFVCWTFARALAHV